MLRAWRHGRSTLSTFHGTTVNSASNFTAVSNFDLCDLFTPIFLTGFESGKDSSVVRNGLYSLKVTDTSGSAASHVRQDASISGTVAVARLGVRLESVPTTNATLVRITTLAGNTFTLNFHQPTGKFEASIGSASQVSSVTAAEDVWYLIDLKVDVGADPRTADWRIDGVAQTQVSSADLSLSQTAADYPIGDGKVLPLIPNGTGTHNNSGNFLHDDDTAIDATSATRIDDQPFKNTDYVKQVANDAAGYLEFRIPDTTRDCINGVAGLIGYTSATTTANAGKASIYNGTTENVIHSGDMSGTSLSYRSALVNPANGVRTQDQVNALLARIGYASSVASVPYWDALLVEAAVDL